MSARKRGPRKGSTSVLAPDNRIRRSLKNRDREQASGQ